MDLNGFTVDCGNNANLNVGGVVLSGDRNVVKGPGSVVNCTVGAAAEEKMFNKAGVITLPEPLPVRERRAVPSLRLIGSSRFDQSITL